MDTKDGKKNKLHQPTGGKKERVKGLSYNTLGDQKLNIDSDKKLKSLDKDDTDKNSADDKYGVNREKEQNHGISFFQLFRFAGCLDVLFMFLGSLGAILLGMTLPYNFIIYGEVIDDMLLHLKRELNDTRGYNNSTHVLGNHSTVYEDVTRNVPSFCYVAVAAFAGGFIQMNFWMLAAERQVHRLRMKLFHSIITKEIGWFDQAKIGDITTKLTEDLQTIEAGISNKLACLIQWSSTFVTGFLLGFLNGWKLTLVILATSPLIIMAGGTAAYIYRRMSENEQKAYGEAGAVAEETLAAIRTVTAFGGQDKEVQRYSEQLLKAKSAGIKKGLLNGLGKGFTWTVMLGMFGVAFWFGTKMVASGEYSGGTVIQVFFACIIGGFQLGNAFSVVPLFPQAMACAGKMYHIINQVFSGCVTSSFSLGEALPNLQYVVKSHATARILFKLIDKKSEIDPMSRDGLKPEKLQGNISFREVSFSYPSRPECQVLTSLSFDVRVGQTVAIVGPSGCGKSTIIQLLQRFYNTQSGEICLDGHNMSELNVEWLRERVGVVSQEPVLFNTSIRENIGFGKKGASMGDIQEAAVMANAHTFIEDLPLKYETLVGEQGTQLSGGQKQRVAIARAVVRNPRILLLDEATSALDTQSEALVQRALDRASEGRTTIVVAHRLSTIKHADLILVMSKGRVEETGSHDDLMAKHGLYYSMVNRQNKASEKAEGKIEEDMVTVEVDSDQSDDQLEKDSRDKLSDKNIDKSAAPEEAESVDESVEADDDLPQVSILSILKLNAPQWPSILVGSLLAIISGAMHPAFAIIISEFMNNFGTIDREEQMTQASILAGAIVSVAVSCGLAYIAQSYFFGIAGENLTLHLRKLAFAAMLKQEMAWFDEPQHTVGVLTAQLSTDAYMIRGAAVTQLSLSIQSLSTFTIAASVAFTFGWKLAFLVVGFFPFIVVAHFFQAKMYHSIGKKNKLADEESSKIALEAIQNIRTVATLGRERHYEESYKKYHDEILKRGRSGAFVFGLTQGFSQCVIFFCYAATFAFGSYLLETRQIIFVNLMRVFLCISLAGLAIGRSSSVGQDVGKAKFAASKIFQLIYRDSHIDPSNEQGLQPANCNGEVKLEDTHFVYPSRPNVEVLRGLNLNIRSGETVALVGSSGCGKTTVIALIQRFYDLQSGSVSIGGHPCTELNLQWLRTQLGLVSQEPVLFNMSIQYNIQYGDNSSHVTMAQVIQAAKMANIHSFIQNLPQGYNTLVGDKGVQLSGGQKQRIAIARALIRNPRILLLDEATSALDAESEQLVQAALDTAAEGRTCIVIAHRLSTVQNADRIVVIREGRAVEQGTHEQLMASGGVYYSLHRAQKGKVVK